MLVQTYLARLAGLLTFDLGTGRPPIPEPYRSALTPPADPRYPVPNPSLSYWLQNVRADPLLNHRTTPELPGNASVVIIGSGMSGSLMAYELLHSPDPPESVVLLEARETCSGATGRNAGHCKPDQYKGFLGYAKAHGKAEAAAILDQEWMTFTSLVKFVEDEKIDCDLWVGDTLDVALTQGTLESSNASYQAYIDYAGQAVRDRVEFVHDPEEAKRISRLKDAKGLWRWKAASFYPWKVAAYLLRKSLSKGLNLQTHTLVRSVTRANAPSSVTPIYTISTDRGDILTPIVIHATNAFASTLLPQLQSSIQPSPFICTKVVPPRVYSGNRKLNHTYLIMASEDVAVSLNTRASSDGILLFGGNGFNQNQLDELVKDHPEIAGDDRLGNFVPIAESVQDLAEAQFEGWPKKEEFAVGEGYDYNWSGVLGMTDDHLPIIGEVPGQLAQFVLAGFNGHGMARIFGAAPEVVKLVLDRSLIYNGTKLPKSFEMTTERMTKIGRASSARP